MSSAEEFVKARQKVASLQSKLAINAKQLRKIDTRHKIELGGLVIKAGLGETSKAIILGALLSAMEQMQKEPETKKLFQLKGEASFMGFSEKSES